ncbi:MAG: dihydrolipoyllysine succinyltransferase [Acidobacteria bacterium RIFCSPLOWO2_12_FULL_59_11]|nr:MAG: dihydrolipoyllysine succinyltransferase [Acidobacteria bacterium RIFCSPLOWO2_12_FULL_59_11]
MPTDVLMPQMGESVAEGTITKWLKKEGESVAKDELLFEISTEKVDAEIPSPVAGILTKILVLEGQTVGVRTVVAQIEPAVEGKKAPPPPMAAQAKPAATPVSAARVETPGRPPAVPPAAAEEAEEEPTSTHASPLVRRLAKEYNVDLSQVEGTGTVGRITKEDLLAYLERQKAAVPSQAPSPAPPSPAEAAAAHDEVIPMSPMRKRIAEHMVLSRRTSAHVATVFQVDLTRVVEIYHQEKERFERQENTRLTYTPFLVRAAIDALQRFPVLNSSVSGDNILIHKDIHIGIAVALEGGLIVPVIHHADEKSFRGLTRAINDLADRARHKKLSVSEVQGGTFTITNPGVYGGLFATPIINQPQVGVLGVGTIYKAPVVINDGIAIRSVAHLALSFDHRVVDGAVADQFMAAVKSYLENWEEILWT